MARITIKAHPRAAPPAEGKATEECVRFLAELAGVARSRVRVVSGATARTKIVEVEGVTQEDLEARLGRGTG
jgi:uncharacterized protein YggU (UPF0235/DUF167 family)